MWSAWVSFSLLTASFDGRGGERNGLMPLFCVLRMEGEKKTGGKSREGGREGGRE